MYSWKTTLWKGLRPALIAALAAAVAALVQSIDATFLISLGIPATLAVFIIEAARNYLKQHKV
jgi:hypothetical protein